MASCCLGRCKMDVTSSIHPKCRRIICAALIINACMFGIELAAGVLAGSMSLLADAINFLGHAVGYKILLSAERYPLIWKARAANVRGVIVGIYAICILGAVIWHLFIGTVPATSIMGLVSVLALSANFLVATFLYENRNDNAIMRTIWQCTLNATVGNLMVFLAALLVVGTGSVWPDAITAAVIAVLGLFAAYNFTRSAYEDMHKTAFPSK